MSKTSETRSDRPAVPPTPAPGPGDDPRRRKLMEAAVTVFLRYGFRKTSMDDVAQAAGVSRQALYLHFATKEELFRASLQHILATTLAATSAALADTAQPIEQRLVNAFDAWVGQFVGTLGPNTADLTAATSELGGPAMAEHEAQLMEQIAKAMRTSGLAAAYKPAGLTARQLATTLVATARGLKYDSASRADFVAGMTIAARVFCLPLRPSSKPQEAPALVPPPQDKRPRRAAEPNS